MSQVPEFEDIVIKANPDGTIIHLKDVARVELGRVSYGFSGKVNGHKSVTCMISQMAGSNATEIIQDCEKLLDDAQKGLPQGLKITVAQNVNDFLLPLFTK